MKPCGHFEMIHKCRVCWLYENDSRYKSIWDGNGLVVSEQGTNVIVENKKKEVKETIEKMKSVVSKPCLHLGLALEQSPSCGCAGGILHECKIHKVCRVSGNTKEMNCWRCPDYIDQASNNDKI